MKVEVISDMVSEPVSLTEIKNWLRIKDFTDDDNLLIELSKSTRKHLEKFTGLSFGIKTLESIVDVDREKIELPYSPVASITSVYELNYENAWELLDVSDYKLIGDVLKIRNGCFKVTYQAGFISLPEDLKTDIKVLVAWQYKNRGLNFEADKDGDIREFPHRNLLNSRLYKKVVI
jgi:uncharacterized phiE125 gp8 family phage protein